MDDSNVTAVSSAIKDTGGFVEVTGGSTITVGTAVVPDGGVIENTSLHVGVTNSTLTNNNVNGAGILNTSGDVDIKSSRIEVLGVAVEGTDGNVTVTGATSVITGGLGGIYDTGGNVQIGTGVEVYGGAGAAISGTDGAVVVGSALGGATISGAEGIVDTGGDLTVIKSDITATSGDGIRGVSGKVEITDTSVDAVRDGINISNNSVYGNVINNLDIIAGEDGLVAVDTTSLAVNLTKPGEILAANRAIYADGSTNLSINSINGSGLLLSTDGNSIEVSGGATLNDNVETTISSSGGKSGVYVTDSGSNANFTEDLKISLFSSNGIGIHTTNGGIVNASADVSIESSYSGVRGIVSTGAGSSVTIDGITSIDILADNAMGIDVADGGTVNLNDVNVSLDGSGMMTGLYAEDAGSSINVSGDLDVYVHGETFAGGLEATLGGTITADSITQIIAFTYAGDAYGVWADEGSTINAKFNGLEETSIIVSASNGNAYGVAATSETQNSNIVIENAGDIKVSAEDGNAYGLFADPSTISGDAENITVTATGDAYGAYAYDSSTIDVEVSGAIDVKSTESGLAIGIGAKNLSSADVLMDEGTITVTSALGDAYGVNARDNSNVTLEGAQAMVISASEEGYGVYAYNNSDFSGDIANITVTAGDDAFGAYAELESAIVLDMSGDVFVRSYNGGDALGIGAETSGDVTVTGLGDLEVRSDTGYAGGIGAEENSGIDVSMLGDITVIAGDSAIGIGAAGNSDVTVKGLDELIVMTGTGDAGGIGAISDSYINVAMTGDISVVGGNNAVGVGSIASSDVAVTGLIDINVIANSGVAAGIAAGENSTADVSMSGNINIQALSDDAYGVTAQRDSGVKFSGVGDISVFSGGGNAFGVNAFDESIISGDAESIFVSTVSGDAFGAIATDNSEIGLVLSGDITVYSYASGDAVGIGSAISSDVTVTGLNDLEVYALDETVGGPMGDATGIGAVENSHVSVSMDGKIHVETKDGTAAGAVALAGSHTELHMSGGDMEVYSTMAGEAIGIGAAESGEVMVTGLSDLIIRAVSGDAVGITAINYSSADVSMTGGISVLANIGNATGIGVEDNSYAILRMDTDKTDNDIIVGTNAGNAYGAVASGDSDIVFENVRDLNVTTASGNAYGLFANDPSTISGDVESITVTVMGIGDAYGAYAYSESTIDAVMSGDITVTSWTGDAYGIFAETSSDVTITGLQDLKVQVTAAASNYAYGINAEDNSTADVTMTGDILVTTAGTGESLGVAASNNSGVTLSTEGGITVESETGDSYGIGAEASYVTVTGLTDLEVTVATAGEAYGIVAYDISTIDVQMTGDITVDTADGDAVGVAAHGGSKVYLTGAGAMEISAANGEAYGLLATSGAIISADVESIEVTASDNAYGIGAVYSGKIEAILNGDVTVMSTSIGRAVGIGTDHDGFTEVRGLEDLFVTTVSGDVVGIGADNGGYTEVEMNGDITVKSTVLGQATGIGVGEELGGYVIVTGLQDMYVDANAGPAIGIAAQYGASAEVEMDGTAYVETQAGPAFGIYAYDGSEVKLTGGDLDVTGASRVRGLYAEEDASIYMTDGDIAINDITDSAYMEVYNGGAIYLSGVTANTFEHEIIDEDRTLITTDSYGTLSADMGTVIGGNMIHTGIESGDLDITITGGSKIIGAANVPYYNEASINITLDSLADTWEVTADSYTNGTLTNRGIVDYQNVESLLDYNDGIEPGDFKTISVYDFVGNDTGTPEDETGILKMKADINGGLNDLLIADDSATGVNRLEIQNLTNSGVERSGTLVLVEDDETDLELSIADPDEINAFGQYLIHAGAWSYELVSEETEGLTKEWYLERYSLTSTGVGIVSSMVNADVWYREVGTLLNRMGIYRDGDYYGGFWFEAAANKQEIDGGFGSQYDQQFTNFTVGWDKMYEKEKGDLFIGIMGGYGKADRDIGSIGTTDLESTHAALYGIYRTHDGFYATGLVKYNKYDNDMSLFGVDKFSRRLLDELGEDRVKGNWDQDGYGISLQIGKRMDRENGWYLEPQAQLSWMRINGENYRTNTGIQVGIDDSDSFRGRLGLLVGRTMQLKDETKLDLFGSLSLVHEFDGDTDITMSGGKWTSDLGGTWGVVGAGFNWNFQPGKYVHGGVSYATGDNRDEPWGVYLGLSIELGGSRPAKEKTEEAAEEVETEAEAETSSEAEAPAGNI